MIKIFKIELGINKLELIKINNGKGKVLNLFLDVDNK